MGGKENHECTKLTYLLAIKIIEKEKESRGEKQEAKAPELVNEQELEIKQKKKMKFI